MITKTLPRSSRGFTMIEVLVVLSIAALLAAFLIPQFMDTKDSAEESSTETMSRQLQETYDNWAALGGSHTITGSTDLTLALCNLLGGAADTTVSNTPNYVAVAGDAQAIREQRRSHPLPGTIRTRFSGALATESVSGSPEVIYQGKFIIRFVPSSTKTGTWTMTRMP